MADRFITLNCVLDRVCLSRTEIYRRIKLGTFPQSVALGQMKAVFLEREVNDWMQARVAARSDGRDWRVSRARKAVNSRADRAA